MATVIYKIHKLEIPCPTIGGDSLCDDRERAHLTLGEKQRPHGRSRGFINVISVCCWMSDIFFPVYTFLYSPNFLQHKHTSKINARPCAALSCPLSLPLPQ